MELSADYCHMYKQNKELWKTLWKTEIFFNAVIEKTYKFKGNLYFTTKY